MPKGDAAAENPATGTFIERHTPTPRNRNWKLNRKNDRMKSSPDAMVGQSPLRSKRVIYRTFI
jgi:hypothetical protein